MIRDIVIMLLACCAFVGCGDSRTDAWPVMDAAEALMDERPDSALALMRSIPAAVVAQGEEQARRALLPTMAELKAHRPADPDSVISIAHEYYKGNGHRRGQMLSALYGAKARYYAGRDTASVILLAKEAYDLSKALGNDTILARSAEMLEDLYHDSYSRADALEYCREAIDAYHRAGLVDNECFVRLDYASMLIEMRRSEDAVSMVDSVLAMNPSDQYRSMVLIDCNVTKLQGYATSSMPEKSLPIYEEICQDPEYSQHASVISLFASFAKYKLGDYVGANAMLDEIDIDTLSPDYYYLYYFVRAKSMSGLNMHEEARIAQDKYEGLVADKTKKILYDNIPAIQEQYLGKVRSELVDSVADSRYNVKRLTVIVIVSLLVLGLVVVGFMRHSKRQKAAHERRVNDFIERTQALDDSISILDNEVAMARMNIEAESNARKKFENKYGETFESQFKIINNFCSTYTDLKPADKVKQQAFYQNTKSAVEKLRSDRFYVSVYNHVNESAGCLFDKIKALDIFSSKEIKLLVFLQTSSSIHTIALILELEDSSVYTMRRRMREKLDRLCSDIPSEILDALMQLLA